MSADPSNSGSIRALPREYLQSQIVEGALRPGLIVSPAAISTDLGVSSTPVREALIELARDGFLENLPRRGFVVRALSTREATELFSVCWMLERSAVEAAIPSLRTLDRLDRINAQLVGASSALARHRLDCRWHETLISESSNTTLSELMTLLRARLRRYEVAYFRHGGTVPVSAHQHTSISNALRNGNLASALDQLKANWLVSLPLLSKWLDQNAEKKPKARR